MKIHADLSPMPPAVQAAVRQPLDALTQTWPGPGPQGERTGDDAALLAVPTSFPRPVRGSQSFVRPRIVELLRQYPEGLSLAEIEQHIPDVPNLKYMVSDMSRAGQVKRLGRARYGPIGATE